MRLIRKVEINYFRSVYSLTAGNLRDINVLIGANDSGKSNVLKALNLFFNNTTELNTSIDFQEDLSKHRAQEVREVKGRATIWIKVTFNNALQWESLPQEFTIKRTWNRYELFPHQDVFPAQIPNTTIGRLLNKLDFHYIPAIRSRQIFSYYLSLLHDSLIEDERAGVRQASTALIQNINDNITDMSQEIFNKLGFESAIDVPNDLRNLFEALDFSTTFSNHKVALQRRGDGIQARHVPFILDFLAKRSKKIHLWAYEEPENSLEMSNAFELAQQFSEDFSSHNQIFLTTHSPAFYDITGDHVSKWLIKSEKIQERNETTGTEISEQQLADNELGITVLIRDRARELYKHVRELRSAVSDLQHRVQRLDRPGVIVEGPSDKKILEAAYKKLRQQDWRDVEFISADGARNITQFFKGINNIGFNRENPLIGLYDNDSGGRKEEQRFNKYHYHSGTKFRAVNLKSRLYVGLFVPPNELSEIVRIFRKLGRDVEGIPLSVEFMFPMEVIERAYNEQVLQLKNQKRPLKDLGLQLEADITQLIENNIPSEYWYFAKEIDDSCKMDFAEYIQNLGADKFEYFWPSLQHIHKVIEDNRE